MENNREPGGAGAFLGTPKEKLAIIMGAEGLARLDRARVMVLGLGGVGSNCVEALARGGVGHLVVLDHDIVSESNINRQAIAYRSTLGRKKVDVVRAMVADINPACEVETIDSFVRAADVAALMDEYAPRVDYVVDAIDSVSTKLALAEYADRTGLTLISSMGGGNKLHPECLRIADVYDTVKCPLSRVMRKECRKRGVRSLRVLFSFEDPVRTRGRAGATRKERSDLGTASFMPPIMGQMIAGEVIRHLAGVGES